MKKTTLNGIVYKSVTEALRKNGLTYSKLKLLNAEKKEKTPLFSHEGIDYFTLTEFSLKNKVSFKIAKQIKENGTNIPEKRKYHYLHNGKLVEFKKIKECFDFIKENKIRFKTYDEFLIAFNGIQLKQNRNPKEIKIKIEEKEYVFSSKIEMQNMLGVSYNTAVKLMKCQKIKKHYFELIKKILEHNKKPSE
jgi:hypothetical protein